MDDFEKSIPLTDHFIISTACLPPNKAVGKAVSKPRSLIIRASVRVPRDHFLMKLQVGLSTRV